MHCSVVKKSVSCNFLKSVVKCNFPCVLHPLFIQMILSLSPRITLYVLALYYPLTLHFLRKGIFKNGLCLNRNYLSLQTTNYGDQCLYF